MTHHPESFPSPEHIKLEIMQEDFCCIFDENKKLEAAELFKKIIEEYQAENRAYHSFDHIEKLLSFLKEYEQEIKDQTGVKLAAYFHDIVYDTKTKDNEEKSAQFAQDYLKQIGIPDDVINHVMTLIRATVKHEIIDDDSDSAIFLDGDLAILGSNKDTYDEYASKIRQEYIGVPDDQYRAGRKKVLENFLNRSKIYVTEMANKDLEEQARKNIKREIASLS